jgi:hypothetical protein
MEYLEYGSRVAFMDINSKKIKIKIKIKNKIKNLVLIKNKLNLCNMVGQIGVEHV